MSKRGPQTPRVWSDRWIRVQEDYWRPRRWQPVLDDDGSPVVDEEGNQVREYDLDRSVPATYEPPQSMWKRIARHNKERAQKGYSVYDWWSFDTFVCGLIANACRDFRLIGHGHPGDMTEEEWNAYLLEIEEPLRVWAEEKFDLHGDEEMAAYRAAQEAMAKFTARLGYMWD